MSRFDQAFGWSLDFCRGIQDCIRRGKIRRCLCTWRSCHSHECPHCTHPSLQITLFKVSSVILKFLSIEAYWNWNSYLFIDRNWQQMSVTGWRLKLISHWHVKTPPSLGKHFSASSFFGIAYLILFNENCHESLKLPLRNKKSLHLGDLRSKFLGTQNLKALFLSEFSE